MARSEYALRRMVAQLQSMSNEDFDAVMDTLSHGQRGTVLSLLEELEGNKSKKHVTDELTLNQPSIIVPDNISPWLQARINGNPAANEEVTEHFFMTPQAIATLRQCAAELIPQPPAKTLPPSLLSKLWRRITGCGVAA